MSVIVRGMEMPKTCCDCPIFVDGGYDSWCGITDNSMAENEALTKRNPNCPLVEIPTPHGRLGDLDALKAQYKYGEADSEDERLWMMNIRRAITNAPTVIEAEGSEE